MKPSMNALFHRHKVSCVIYTIIKGDKGTRETGTRGQQNNHAAEPHTRPMNPFVLYCRCGDKTEGRFVAISTPYRTWSGFL